MKKVFIFIILIFTFIILIPQLNLTPLNNLFSYSICDKPIHYRIDTVDPKFSLSRDEFLADVNQAAQIWNNVRSKDLYIYDPKGELSVNLIYDERQSLLTQVNSLESTVKSDKQSLTPEISEYQRLAAQFKQKLADLNKQIEDWNSKGGAPPDEYKKLIEQQQDLQNQAKNLNTMAKNLNQSTTAYNSSVNQLNQTISSLNSALQERPEEGIFKYPENVIDIYFNTGNQELVHTLAHELGHSIGLEHIQNPKAIMYFRTNQSIQPSQDDIAALTNLCKRHSIFELIQHYIVLFSARYKTLLK